MVRGALSASVVGKMQTHSLWLAVSEFRTTSDFYIVVEACKYSIQLELISIKLDFLVRNISFVLHKSRILWLVITLIFTCNNSEINKFFI